MTTSITKILLLDTDSDQTLVADVLAADPTATTFLLNCPPGTDSNDCGTYNESVIVGPWAKPTPPPDATTGIYDVDISMPDESWSFHIHCDMSLTVPVQCTTTNLGGNDDGHPTATFTVASDDMSMGWGYIPVTITAGLEKLASATDSAGSVVTGGSGTAGTTTLSGTASNTQSATSVTGTNAAVLGRGDPLTGTLALAALAFGWLLQ
ncbi:hypothetical protein JX265_006016 [Neoarthrinium moseri]|uniref:Uncharacterized protein n=1 Tax=Neoarthrinium moseri TaxID=1658444 RepID=A0A9Q0API4_9PEZI|nr:hypothetical protein JX266_000478 [Neoarthrinium moseri]KAI1870976.1 hypothetical protein JX265_006016 [Neoarthrinium moseri]